jgi:large subunit ribosomal protein L22
MADTTTKAGAKSKKPATKSAAPAKAKVKGEAAAETKVERAEPVEDAEDSSYAARHRYARITARKARLIADLIRGRSVNEALEVLQFQHKRAASFYSKLVRSAMANANQNEGVNVNRLVITDCRADDGPMLQNRMRFRPGPQGRAMPFKKLTSHLTVVLTERAEA